MKRKTRTITVDHQQYIWWHHFGERCAILCFSPIKDKTSKITVEFHLDCNSNYDERSPFIGRFPEYVILEKDHKIFHMKTIEPKMAGLLLSFLSHDAFLSHKNLTYDGLELLSEMGYTISGMKEGWYW